MGPSAPLAGAGSFPCQPCLDRLLLQPPLPQRAGYSTLIPSAGCHGKGIFILAGHPPCFFGWVVLPPPEFWGSSHSPGAQIRPGAEGGQGCSAVPSSPGIYLCIQPPAPTAVAQPSHTSLPLTAGALGMRLFLPELEPGRCWLCHQCHDSEQCSAGTDGARHEQQSVTFRDTLSASCLPCSTPQGPGTPNIQIMFPGVAGMGC